MLFGRDEALLKMLLEETKHGHHIYAFGRDEALLKMLRKKRSSVGLQRNQTRQKKQGMAEGDATHVTMIEQWMHHI